MDSSSRLKVSMGGKKNDRKTDIDAVTSSSSSSRLKVQMGQKRSKVNMPKSASPDVICFERSPRLKHELPKDVVEIASPPSAASKPEINWLSTFLPTVVTIGVAIIFAVVMGNVRMMLYTLPMTIAGVVVSITNYTRQTKKYKESIKIREEKYASHLEDAISQLKKLRTAQLDAMILANPETKECFDIAETRSRRMWERRPEDDDFLSVRIGSGKVDASFKISYPKTGLSLEEDDLKSKPQEIYDRYHEIAGAPIVVNILTERICGIVGHRKDATALLKNMIVQMAALHCYSELRIVLICDPSDQNELQWVKDLPHARIGTSSNVSFASSKAEASSVFKNCIEVLKPRKIAAAENDSYGKPMIYLPHYLFLIAQPSFLNRSDPINEYLFRLKDLGVSAVMVVDDLAQLPKECNEIIEIKGSAGNLFRKDNATDRSEFIIDDVNGLSFNTFGMSQSNVVCDEELIKEVLPKQFSFYEMLGVHRADEINIGARWHESNVNDSMAAPIGILDNGNIVSLDIHQKAEGPHGLVAGATGYGKSELLLSYILSMAITYHPYEVGFVLVDFKGGQTASHLFGLPHLIGTITDIDGDGDKTVTRSLMSIKAEVDRRKEILKQYNDSHNEKIDDIYGYIKKYKLGEVSNPLPHLVLIVDEFAELKQDYPDFIKELVSVSRIGRSVGVHLILATQKPGGSVSDEIAVNSRFRLCLHVDASESNEVIKSPLAANIVEKGRAYLRVGENEVLELFQSAFSGGACDPLEAGGNQREAVLETIKRYCAEHNIKKLNDIYLQPLPTTLHYPTVNNTTEEDDNEIVVSVGQYDAPERQYQGSVNIEITGNNTLIIGAPQYGKTNLLQVFLRAFAENYSPNDVNIYVLDFSSSFLKNYEQLPHVGGVVTSSEQERLKNLFKMLNDEIDKRKNILLSAGVSSYKSYREAGFKDIPQIILMIDNFTALKELYFDDEDFLLPICRNGISVGISVIIANAQTGGLIGYNYASTISCKIAFHCNDGDEINSLFGYTRIRPDSISGRCLIQISKNLYEAQAYLAFEGEKEIDRSRKIKRFIEAIVEQYPGQRAQAIPEVPKELNLEDLYEKPHSISKENNFALGVDYSTIDRVVLPFETQFSLALIGKDNRRKQRYIESLLSDISANLAQRDIRLYFVDSVKKDYKKYADLPFVQTYTTHPEELTDIVEDICNQLKERSELLEEVKNEVDSLEKEPLLLVIINNSRALDMLSNSKKHMKLFEDISKNYRCWKIMFLFADVENASVSFSSADILKRIRDERKALIFDSLKEVKLYDISPSAKKQSSALGVSDAFYLDGEIMSRIKLVGGNDT